MPETTVQIEFLTGMPIPGELLSARLRKGELPPQDAIRYAIEIGGVISRAHAQGLVHGSISPYSVIVAELGGAVLIRPFEPPAAAFAVYRSPEQVMGEEPDWRSDIYCYGALLYELVNGEPPFSGLGEELDDSILHYAPAPLISRSALHTAMEGVIVGCLEKDPNRRRQRIQNAVIELKLAGRSSHAPRPRGRYIAPPSAPAPVPAPTPAPISHAAAPISPAPSPMSHAAPASHAAPISQPIPSPEPEPPVEHEGEPGHAPEATAHPIITPAPFAEAEPVPPPRARPWKRSVFSQPVASTAFEAITRRRGTRFWLIAALILLVCVAGIAAVVWLPGRNSSPVYRFTVAPEDSKYPGMPAISPDGHYLTYAGTGPAGKRVLWVRALDESHSKPIPGTEDAGAPFWSPDSQNIGFFANQFLKRVRIVNGSPTGPPQSLCPAENQGGGGSWNKDGVIIFAPGLSTGLSRISANGGKPAPLTTLVTEKFERSHLWPQFMPDGKHFIFYILTDMGETSGVYSGALDSPASPAAYTRVIVSETNAAYSPGPASLTSSGGYLLFIRNGNLMAQPFSASKLEATDEPVTLANNVAPVPSFSLAQVSVSDNGTLVYQSAGKPTRQLLWIDRSGKMLGSLSDPGDWGPPRISPDGRYVAVGKSEVTSGVPVLWMLDSEGHATQLTDTPNHGSISPVWSPDGSKIAFGNDQSGAFDLYVQAATAKAKAELLYHSASRKHPDDWSHDGRFLLFTDFKAGMNAGIYAVTMPDHRAQEIIDTIHVEDYPALSPDGKWLAYQSDEQKTAEVFVQPFDNGIRGTKKLTAVSVNGGGLPRWRRDGAELYYTSQSGRIFAVGFHPNGGDFTVDAPRELFHTRPLPKTWNLYDVSADGQRFLMNVPMEWPSISEIKVTTSWVKELSQ